MVGNPAILAKTRIAVALFVVLLVAGSGVFLSACGTSGGLRGTVASVDLVHSSFVLTPQQNSAGVTSLTVRVSPQTEFRGALHRLADLTPGMGVSVQGSANTSSGAIVATEVEDQPEDQASDQRDNHGASEFKGTIANVSGDHTSFELKLADGTLKTVAVSSQTEFEGMLHSAADLAKGQQVSVKGAVQSDGSIAASSVEGENENEAGDANEIELTGVISSIDPKATSFVLTLADKSSKTIVTTAATEFDGGFSGFGDLKAGMVVEVRGTAQADGSLLATRVHREDGGDSSGSDGHDGSGSGGSSGSGDGSGGSGSGSGSGSGGGSSSGDGSGDGH